MTLRTDGIIIREQTVGEQDRLVTLLTREKGVIRAFVNGGRNPKNKNVSATDLLCYSDFSLEKGRQDAYIIREATSRQVFFELRSNIVGLSLAQYFAELARDFSPKEERSDEFLALLLNALYLICQGKKSPQLIKAVTELRFASLSGFMPDLIACCSCGNCESTEMYFSPSTASLYCESCTKAPDAKPISPGALGAMRHTVLSSPEKIFSFSLSDDSLEALNTLTERYVKSLTMRKYKTLDFYKTMK